MRRISVILLIAALASCQVAKAQVARIMSLKGSVDYLAGAEWQSAHVATKLYKGFKVRCASGGDAVILFSNGNRFLLGSDQTGEVGESAISGAKMLAGAKGASANAAKALGGSRVGALVSRAPLTESRLFPKFKGWFRSEDKRIEWIKRDDAALYCFTIFDHDENVVWSVRTNSNEAEFPEGISEPQTAKPYVWRLSAFTRSGKMIDGATRWGALTFLTQEQEEKLLSIIEPLKMQAEQNKSDNEPMLLIAAVYREAGVCQKALETLDDIGSKSVPKIEVDGAKNEIYNDLGRIALLMTGRVKNKEAKK